MSRLLLPDTSWSAVERRRPHVSIPEVQHLVEAYRQRRRLEERARRQGMGQQARTALQRARRSSRRAERAVGDWQEIRRAQRHVRGQEIEL